MIPIITIVGRAGAGKDSVGAILSLMTSGTTIAFADPLKRIVKILFSFSDDQLWGPSQNRDQIDPRFLNPDTRAKVWKEVNYEIVAHHLLNEEIKKVFGPDYMKALDILRKNVLPQLMKKFEATISPRVVLQYLGTEWGRSISSNVWVDFTKDTAIKLLSGGWKYNQNIGLIPTDAKYCCPFVIITDARFPNEVIALASIGSAIIKVENPVSPEANTHVSENVDLINKNLFDLIILNRKDSLSYLEVQVVKAFAEVFPKWQSIPIY
jgi:hypothetical protein